MVEAQIQNYLVTVQIIKAHTATYPDPISFAAGETVQVERGDAEFPGWFWCRATDGREGWVHQTFLAAASGATTALREYSAMELAVSEGDRGELMESLDGWVLVRLDSGESGWVPLANVELRNG